MPEEILYLIIMGGDSKATKSGSLDFRDIYISIVLFQAAYVWIKFRDVIPQGLVYRRRDSNRFEPRIKFPRGVGGKSKRIPLGSFDTLAEAEVAHRIAAFYCKKRKHTGRLDLGGGDSFSIPALSVDPNLAYEEKLKQVGDQVLQVYAEFEERKASRNLTPSVSGPAFGIPCGECHLFPTRPIQQLGPPLNSGMGSATHCQASQLDPNIHYGVDFHDPGSLHLLLSKTQHELLLVREQVVEKEVENMGWEMKYSELERKHSELERKCSELEQKNSVLERENGLRNHQTN